MTDLKQFKVTSTYINYNRIFLLSDLHLGTRANSIEWIENIKSFFYDFYIPYLKESVREKDYLFILGDVFDSRQLLDIYVMNTAIDIITELSKILPLCVLTGNHDSYKKYDTNINSIIAFKNIPNVNIYNKPIIVTNDKSSILVLPWMGNKENEENYVRANKFDYIFAHTDITGFKYDNGKDIKNEYGLDIFKFKDIKRVFSGHIHKRQEINNFVYIGSPYHTKRSDIGNHKALYIFNPDENSYSFILNNFSPIFQRIYLEYILELSLEEAIKLLDNNYTDIIVPDKHIHLFNLARFIDVLKNCNYKKIETIAERKSSENELINILEGNEIKDILTLMEINISELNYPNDVQTKLKQINKNYYEKAAKDNID